MPLPHEVRDILGRRAIIKAELNILTADAVRWDTPASLLEQDARRAAPMFMDTYVAMESLYTEYVRLRRALGDVRTSFHRSARHVGANPGDCDSAVCRRLTELLYGAPTPTGQHTVLEGDEVEP